MFDRCGPRAYVSFVLLVFGRLEGFEMLRGEQAGCSERANVTKEDQRRAQQAAGQL